MTQQQTERDEALIAKIFKTLRKSRAFIFVHHHESPLLLEIDALLRGDEPAKPDRYVVAAGNMWEAMFPIKYDKQGGSETCTPADHQIHAVAAVLRKHFEPPVYVIQAARCLKDGSPKGGSAELCADFILKGDQ